MRARLRIVALLIMLVRVGASAGETGLLFRCLRETPAYDPRDPMRVIGSFAAGTELRLEPCSGDAARRLAVYRDPSGKEIRALCRARDLGLEESAPPPLDRETPAPATNALAAVNARIFDEGLLFEQEADKLACALDLPLETTTRDLTIYRSYAPQRIEIFGQRPSMAAIYGNPAKVAEIHLMFLNDGDYFGLERGAGGMPGARPTAESQREERVFREALRAQEEVFQKGLARILGRPADATMGMGKARERVSRWDAEGAALLLSVQDHRYLAVRVWPKALADNRGLLPGLTDEKLRARCLANVETRPNGDVVIGEIPMINQGPKGYCVPATYERVLRYLGMTVDMYSLALIGGTRKGGGTRLDLINDAIHGIVQRTGRQVRGGLKLQTSDLKRWIGAGIPLLWSVFVDPEIEQSSDALTAERQGVTLEDWKPRLAKYPAPRNLKPDPAAAHVRLIIGFNEATQEIAYSDSWGDAARERWMTLAMARAITQPNGLSAISW